MLYSSYLPLGVPNWLVIHHAQGNFWCHQPHASTSPVSLPGHEKGEVPPASNYSPGLPSAHLVSAFVVEEGDRDQVELLCPLESGTNPPNHSQNNPTAAEKLPGESRESAHT
jgi:hypothetical protein